MVGCVGWVGVWVYPVGLESSGLTLKTGDEQVVISNFGEIFHIEMSHHTRTHL